MHQLLGVRQNNNDGDIICVATSDVKYTNNDVGPAALHVVVVLRQTTTLSLRCSRGIYTERIYKLKTKFC